MQIQYTNHWGDCQEDEDNEARAKSEAEKKPAEDEADEMEKELARKQQAELDSREKTPDQSKSPSDDAQVSREKVHHAEKQ